MNKCKQVLLTGASGFIGASVLRYLCQQPKTAVHVLVRERMQFLPLGVHQVFFKSFDTPLDLSVFKNVDVLIHCAARVHIMSDDAVDSLAEFRKINVEGTLSLAKQAAEAGVKRFVFISSIKVNGESTGRDGAFRPNDKPNPTDPYGISKYEAEQGLLDIASKTGIEVVIIRPVLVYGPGVQANFLSMMRWLNKGVPLPFGSINNFRSMVAVENLTDLIVTCLDHPAAANEIFLVSDGQDLSTTNLLKKMAFALGKPVCLIPFPIWLLKLIFILIGKKNIGQRLCDSLQVDISKTRDLLGWSPVISVEDSLLNTAHEFLGKFEK